LLYFKPDTARAKRARPALSYFIHSFKNIRPANAVQLRPDKFIANANLYILMVSQGIYGF
jgi:hypothetical protein